MTPTAERLYRQRIAKLEKRLENTLRCPTPGLCADCRHMGAVVLMTSASAAVRRRARTL